MGGVTKVDNELGVGFRPERVIAFVGESFVWFKGAPGRPVEVIKADEVVLGVGVRVELVFFLKEKRVFLGLKAEGKNGYVTSKGEGRFGFDGGRRRVREKGRSKRVSNGVLFAPEFPQKVTVFEIVIHRPGFGFFVDAELLVSSELGEEFGAGRVLAFVVVEFVVANGEVKPVDTAPKVFQGRK